MSDNKASLHEEEVEMLTPVHSQSRRIVIGPYARESTRAIDDPRLQLQAGIPQKYLWRSCCMELDSRAVVFFSQLIVTWSVMAFCIYMLVTNRDCESQKWYGGTLMFLIGIHLPAPKISSQ